MVFLNSLNLLKRMKGFKTNTIFLVCVLSSFGSYAQANNSVQDPLVFRLTVLCILLAVALLVFIVIFLNQRKAVHQQTNSTEVEKKFLRSQLNPHFIFNTLTAIQQFVYGNNQRKAAKFLAEFSKFVRGVLDNSSKEFVLLTEEITVLEHYMNLQKMKFENFDFKIDTIGISPDMVEVPPSFVQPILENSIEHGFNGIDYQGQIEVIFKEINGVLDIVVIDNGIGHLQNNDSTGETNNSSSTSLIKKRVKMFEEEFATTMNYTVESNRIKGEEKGTTVSLQLPMREKE